MNLSGTRLPMWWPPPSGGLTHVKTIQGTAIASVKTVEGLAIASVKTIEGQP